MHKLSTKHQYMMLTISQPELVRVVVYANGNIEKGKVFNMSPPAGVVDGAFLNRIRDHFNSLTDQQYQDFMKTATPMNSLHKVYLHMTIDQVQYSDFIYRSEDYDFFTEKLND